jgi:IS30 family transposase
MGGSSSVSSDQARHELKEPLSMMPQENYVKINDLHAQGWTILEIAETTGWHRTTVSNN